MKTSFRTTIAAGAFLAMLLPAAAMAGVTTRDLTSLSDAQLAARLASDGYSVSQIVRNGNNVRVIATRDGQSYVFRTGASGSGSDGDFDGDTGGSDTDGDSDTGGHDGGSDRGDHGDGGRDDNGGGDHDGASGGDDGNGGSDDGGSDDGDGGDDD